MPAGLSCLQAQVCQAPAAERIPATERLSRWTLGTYLFLLAFTGVLAPVLEETVFCGFLLPSFCKSMPNWAAVALSSLHCGAAHLSSRDLPVRVALGSLLDVTYIRRWNMLTPIIIHGVWNSSVLTLLFALVASGVNVESALKDLR